MIPYETDTTCFIFGISRSGNHIRRIIDKPRKVIVLINKPKHLFNIIIKSTEDLSDFYSEDISGITFTLSNDPHQDHYGEHTNLGYSSIKIHAFEGYFAESKDFNYLTSMRMFKNDFPSFYIRNNIGMRRPNNIIGNMETYFDNTGDFIIHVITFDSNNNYIYIETLKFKDDVNMLTKYKHDFSNLRNGSKCIKNKIINNVSREIKRLLR